MVYGASCDYKDCLFVYSVLQMEQTSLFVLSCQTISTFMQSWSHTEQKHLASGEGTTVMV